MAARSKLLATAAANTGPVFIVGQARSGSSILYRLLQTHAALTRTDQPNLAESHVMDVVARSVTLDVFSMRAFAALDDDEWASFIDATRAYERRRRIARHVPYAVLVHSPRAWASLGCQAVVRSYIEAASARGTSRVLEKTPQHLHWVPHLARTFPDATMVCITRHPVTTLASYRRRWAEDAEATWADVTLDTFCKRWRTEAGLIRRWEKRYPERFRLLRYEQLVADPDAAQQQLFTWLGITPLRHLPGVVAPSPFAPPSEVEHLYGPITPTGTDWRAYVRDEEVDELEARLATPMALLGIDPIGTTDLPDSDEVGEDQMEA